MKFVEDFVSDTFIVVYAGIAFIVLIFLSWACLKIAIRLHDGRWGDDDDM